MEEMIIRLEGRVTAAELKKSHALFSGLAAATNGLSQVICEQIENILAEKADLLEADDEILILDSPENIAAIFREHYAALSKPSVIRVRQSLICRARTVGAYVILSGSIIPEPRPSCNTFAKKIYEKAVADGIIDVATHTLLEDLEVNSASTACTIVSGYNVNGPKILNEILWP